MLKSFSRFLRKLQHRQKRRANRWPLRLESLEERCVLSVSFQSGMSYGVAASPLYHAVGDLNADGKLDLAVASSESNNVSVLLGNGDGSFLPAGNYFVPAAIHVTIGDVNGDGKVDLVVPNTYDFSTTVGVLLGNGDGTFQSAINSVGTAYTPYVAELADFNADGKVDLAVANGADQNGSNNVTIMLGNGNGTFQPGTHFASGGSTSSLVIHDFNGDGRSDLAVANMSANFSGAVNTLGILLGNGDGTFQPPTIYSTPDADPGSGLASVAKGDFNGDGRMDLAISRGGCGHAGILIGNGNGTFQQAVNYPTGLADSHALTVGDFDGDHKADLAVVGFLDSQVSLLLGNGNGTLQPPVLFAVPGSGLYSVRSGDFTGDGKADLSAAGYYSQNVSILLNTSDPPILTALQKIALIQDQVNQLKSAGFLSSGNSNALMVKLDAAIASLNRGNKISAANQLNAFINQVNAFKKSGKLSQADAQSLIAGANDAITTALNS